METASAIAYFSNSPPSGTKPKFTAYTEDDVRRALLEMFGTKCAYCEFEYAAGAPPDAEHYRPKNRIELSDGTRIEHGYYWLAATWTNLLPTCIDCNRERRHRFEGGVRKTGKGSRFPLVDETKRARGPGGEMDEEPLLLDPTSDAPSAHLSFEEDGIVRPAAEGAGTSPRGAKTINVLGLNRPELVKSRQKTRLWLELAIRRFEEFEQQLVLEPDNEFLQTQRDGALTEMEQRASSGEPFAAMVRQLLAALT
jgi:uncharacterized protein (TIGR02646 family)